MSNANCWPRETLKQYLNGSTDEARLTAIEAHLIDCESCEQTLLELERDPDTLLVVVREQIREPMPTTSAVSENSPSQANSMRDADASVIQRAVDAIKQLPGLPMASAGPVGNGSEKLRQIGAYELVRPLGRGGMGLVMLARHVNLRKEVAIKILPSLIGDRPELVQRFQREMRAVGQLNHPSIVNSTDAGAEQGTHYLVMEYIDGLDLSRVARLAGLLAIADACELIRQAALGLSYAHAEGIVHRDIKPSNLMLDRTGRVKILDFGLAQINHWDEAACELTTVGQLMGTLDYMAPEQAERVGPVDYRADLYALGATLFRLLTGRAPLAAAPHMTLLEKVRLLGTQSPPQVSSLREDCPADLNSFIAKLLSRDPAARPASAAHVAEALAPFCAAHDLISLLSRAREQAVAQADAPQAKHTLPLAATAMPLQQVPPKPPRRRWLALAWLAPVAALAGVLITLETQKGQLVIESEVADVQVKLARRGKFYNELAVKTGTQATRLYADQYEISIDGPSDELALDQKVIEVRRGGTVVARITRKAKAAAEPLPMNNSSGLPEPVMDIGNLIPPTSPGLLYSGRSLEEWLGVLERDLDVKSQLETLPAIATLAQASDATTRGRIIEALLSAVRSQGRQASWHPFTPSRSAPHSQASDILKVLIELIGEDTVPQLMIDKVFTYEGQVTDVALAILLDLNSPLTKFDREFCQWLFEPTRFAKLSPTNAWRAISYLEFCLARQDAVAEMLPDIIAVLRAHPQLGLPAVLAIDFAQLNGPSSSRGAAEESLVNIALEAILNNDTAPDVVAIATSRLVVTTASIEDHRDDLVAFLRQRLEALAADESRLLSGLTKGPWWGKEREDPVLEAVAWAISDSRRDLPRNRVQKRLFGSEIIAMLGLVERLNATRELDTQLTSIAQVLFKRAHRLILAQQRFSVNGPSWPFDASELQSLPETHKDFAPDDWRAAKIFASLDELSSTSELFDTQLYQVRMEFQAQLLLERYDINGDGLLSKIEAIEMPQPRFTVDAPMERLQITDRNYSYHLRAFRARWFDPLNTNGDKVLSPAEASSLLDESAFSAADTDYDGSLSLKEYAFYHAKHPPKSSRVE